MKYDFKKPHTFRTDHLTRSLKNCERENSVGGKDIGETFLFLSISSGIRALVAGRHLGIIGVK